MAAFALTTPLFSQPKADPPKKEPALKVGDPAPKLEAAKWLTKQEGKGFEKDTVSVVCFLQTYGFDETSVNRDCLNYLSEWHDAHTGKGLNVAGVVYPTWFRPGSEDKPLTEEQRERGERHLEWLTEEAQSATFPVAWDSKRRLHTAFFPNQDDPNQLFGRKREDPPEVFVIDPKGKIAYFGDYEGAAFAAEKLLAGTWKGKADIDSIADGRAKWKKLIDGMYDKYPSSVRPTDKQLRELRDTDIPAMEALVKEHPSLAAERRVQFARFQFHTHSENAEFVGEYIRERTAVARKRKSLDEFNSILHSLKHNLNRKPSEAMCGVVSKFAETYAKLTVEFKKGHPQEMFREVTRLSAQYGLDEQVKAYSKEVLARLDPQERVSWQDTLDVLTRPRVLLGDPAPPLNVEKWLHGKEIPKFEKGKVCLVAFLNEVIYPAHVAWEVSTPGRGMPSAELSLLADLAEREAKNGLVVVGVVRERFLPKTDEKRDALLALHTSDAKRSRLTFPVGWGSESKTGVGYSVNGGGDYAVIDQDGRLVYSGHRFHPMNAVYVAKRVLDGKWNVADANKRLDREVDHENSYYHLTFELEKELREAGFFLWGDRPYDAKKVKEIGEAYLPKLEKAFKENPVLLECGTQRDTLFTASGAIEPVRFSLHLLAGKYDMAESLLTERVKRSVELKNPYILRDYAANLVYGRFEATPQMKKLVEKASKELEPLAGRDTLSGVTWLHLAAINSAYGNDDKADEYFEKATVSVSFRQLQEMVKEYDELREKAGKSRR